MSTPRRREVILLIILFASLLGLLALAGFRAEDPTLLGGEGTTENEMGRVGANFAALAYYLLGAGAWLLLMPVVIVPLKFLGRNVWSKGKVLSFVVGVVCLTSVCHLIAPAWWPVILWGGIIGGSIAGVAQSLFSVVGASLVVFICAVLAMTYSFDLNWPNIAATVAKRFGIWAPRLADHTRKVSGVGLGKSRVLLGWFWRQISALFGFGWYLVKSTFARMSQSLRRRNGAWAENSSIGGYDNGSTTRGTADSDATQVRVARPKLAEVEWDPTKLDRTNHQPEVTSPRLFSDPQIEVPDEPEDVEDSTQVREVTPLDDEAKVAKGEPVATTPLVVHSAKHLEVTNEDDGGALQTSFAFDPPRLDMLDLIPKQRVVFDKEELRALAAKIVEKLGHFKVRGQVTDIRPGPVVTIFEFLPHAEVKVSRIAGLADDLALALSALSVRIVAPIPGKGVVGIEIPSPSRLTVFLREVLASAAFRETKAALPVVLGKDAEGAPVVADLAGMPHLLVGGTTGSGKSVGVNGMLMSLLFKKSPQELRLLLIDPKMLEFGPYEGIPHLLHPVVTEPKSAAFALAWACREMDERYSMMKKWKSRNISSFNKKAEKLQSTWSRQLALEFGEDALEAETLEPPDKMPYIVIVIDELADLMMVAKKDVETNIARIAQKARACGMHLIVATQRPSVDVITGVIKANLPTRLAYQLRTGTDSRTVLGSKGAESLLGKGDCLFLPPGSGILRRCHGAFVSDEEVGRVMSYLVTQGQPNFVIDMCNDVEPEGLDEEVERDALFDECVDVVVRAGKASTSLLQRHLKIGYNRAARIIDNMERAGIIGPADGSRPREVLINESDYNQQ